MQLSTDFLQNRFKRSVFLRIIGCHLEPVATGLFRFGCVRFFHFKMAKLQLTVRPFPVQFGSVADFFRLHRPNFQTLTTETTRSTRSTGLQVLQVCKVCTFTAETADNCQVYWLYNKSLGLLMNTRAAGNCQCCAAKYPKGCSSRTTGR